MKKIFIIIGIIFFVLVISAIIMFFKIKSSPASKVGINSAIFNVELARTQEEQIKGLSGRKSLPQDRGMLFVFDKPSYYSFWMRDMQFPLDLIFILDNKVVRIFENVPAAAEGDENPPQFGAEVLSDKVLEINAGLAAKNKIKVGDTVTFEFK